MEYIEDEIRKYICYQNDVKLFLKNKKIHGEPIDVDIKDYGLTSNLCRKIHDLSDMAYLYKKNLLGVIMKEDFEKELKTLNSNLQKAEILELLLEVRK
ncbi:hypothetical protein C8N46_101705 [Kordia periserrulae]|uniref:Uncharacterized protein n=1 Tax=Kordia periserrulae TaxID=701523 RepID=A0A2T6C729_9FLAO|nr:hypothetical protein [Kordia periserrulae]PTX64095.1 hypothetical protein C8N46_101705 [Kordia periserrulae]